jgi:DNA-binding NarL/FixJ family response regulator
MEGGLAPIRVVIAEDNRDLCCAITALLQSEDDIVVVGEVARVRALIDTVRNGDARVVILDLDLDGESSVPAMLALRRELPSVAVVVYSGYDRGDIAPALPDDASIKFVSKTGDIAELLQAVRRAAATAVAGAGS